VEVISDKVEEDDSSDSTVVKVEVGSDSVSMVVEELPTWL
jgi:hypothetical protein